MTKENLNQETERGKDNKVEETERAYESILNCLTCVRSALINRFPELKALENLACLSELRLINIAADNLRVDGPYFLCISYEAYGNAEAYKNPQESLITGRVAQKKDFKNPCHTYKDGRKSVAFYLNKDKCLANLVIKK